MTQESSPSNPTALVIGGGVAGIAAAVALESAGLNVTLLEARKSLGGRASSFIDPQSGQEIDNCQHVLLGCCTNLLDLYRRLKCDHLIRFEKAINFRDENGKRHQLSATAGLPAPTHLSASFATFGILSLTEKIAYSRAMLAMLRLGRQGRAALMDIPFGQWLDDHHQPASLVQKMYEPVLVGALNEDCRKCSATYAIQVFQDAMLAHAAGYVVGVPMVPLSQLYGEYPCRNTRLGVRVDELRFDGDKILGATLANGEQINADVVVLATNHHAVQKWIPLELAAKDERFKFLDQLQSVPILGVHMEFDRPVLSEPHAALTAGPLQWLFRKDADGKTIAGVISASRDYIGRPKEDCLKEFEQQVRKFIPEAVEAKLIRGVIVIEKRATFAPLPGIDRLRPHQAPPAGGIQNLYLAGDYTQTGWPATMEGAARSGYLTADAVLARIDRTENSSRPFFSSSTKGAERTNGPQHRYLVADLSSQWPARLLGL